jgi:hypothetical protein
MVFDREADTQGGGTQDEEVLTVLPIFHTMSDDSEKPLTSKDWKRCFNDTLIRVAAELDPKAPPSARKKPEALLAKYEKQD